MLDPVPTGRPRGRPPQSGVSRWRTASDIQLLSLMHRRQAAIYRRYQLSLLKRLKDIATDPKWMLTEGHNEELQRINQFLKMAVSNVLELEEAKAQLAQNETTDILLAQLRHEFCAAARTFTEDELRLLVRNLPDSSWPTIAEERQKMLRSA